MMPTLSPSMTWRTDGSRSCFSVLHCDRIMKTSNYWNNSNGIRTFKITGLINLPMWGCMLLKEDERSVDFIRTTGNSKVLLRLFLKMDPRIDSLKILSAVFRLSSADQTDWKVGEGAASNSQEWKSCVLFRSLEEWKTTSGRTNNPWTRAVSIICNYFD